MCLMPPKPLLAAKVLATEASAGHGVAAGPGRRPRGRVSDGKDAGRCAGRGDAGGAAGAQLALREGAEVGAVMALLSSRRESTVRLRSGASRRVAMICECR